MAPRDYSGGYLVDSQGRPLTHHLAEKYPLSYFKVHLRDHFDLGSVWPQTGERLIDAAIRGQQIQTVQLLLDQGVAITNSANTGYPEGKTW